MTISYTTIMTTVAALLIVASTQASENSQLIQNLEAGQSQIVVTYGTSLTAGGAWVKHLQQALNKSYPGKANVINSAKSGMWSDWGVKHLDQRVITKNPDTVIIEFAINDAFLKYKTSVEQARTNLEEMIKRVLAHNPDCEIMLMVMNPPIGIHLERRPKIKEYYQMYRDVASDRELLLIDHYPAWEKILNQNEDAFSKLVPDGIHPNAQGCTQIITPAILKAIGLSASQKAE